MNLGNNPVIKFVKEKPLIAGGILAGGLGLAYFLRPKTDENNYPVMIGEPEYPEMTPDPNGNTGGGSVDTSYVDGQLAMMEDYLIQMSEENANAYNQISDWIGSSFGEINSSMSSMGKEFDSIYNRIDRLNQTPAIPENIFSPSPETKFSSQVFEYQLRPDLNIPQPDTYDIRKQMNIAGERWREIYETTGRMDTPEQEALHQENLMLASQIGGSYNPSSGTYNFQGFSSPVSTTPKATPSLPASGVGSNQYIYLQNLVKAGGGNGEWAKKELSAGRY